jgi:DNA-binding CsgD family transcriptional regulator
MTARISRQFSSPSEPANEPSSLTPRQMEILVLLRAGKANKAIAHELGIGLGTVKQHMVALFKKLNVTNRAMAVSRSLDFGQPEQKPPPQSIRRLSDETADAIMELRPVCILSLSVAPPKDAGEETTALCWQKLQQAVTSSAMSSECTVIGRPGVGLDVIFGLYRASDEDALRALELARSVYAALDVRTPESRLNDFDVHAGMASGYLLASMMPRGGWTGETVAGRVIGRARELRSASHPGFLQADPSSLELIVFAQRAERTPEIPGSARISLSSQVRRPSKRPSAPPHAIIGRESEIDVLAQHVQTLSQGKGGIVWVEGESGMGKTTLCRSMDAMCKNAGMPLVDLRCGKGRPSAEMLTGYEHRPLAVVIDDLHVATEDQARHVTALAALTKSQALLLIGAGRSARHPLLQKIEAQSTLRLGRLTPAAIESLVDDKGGAALSPQTRAQVIELCQGVPLFAVEMVRSLSARLGRPQEGFRLPLTLVTLVTSRLDSIQVDRRLLHQLPSLIPFSPGSLGEIRLGPKGRLAQEIDRAIGVGLLVQNGGRVDFAHPLVKDVIRTITSAAPLDSSASTPAEAGHLAALKEKSVAAIKQLRLKG